MRSEVTSSLPSSSANPPSAPSAQNSCGEHFGFVVVVVCLLISKTVVKMHVFESTVQYVPTVTCHKGPSVLCDQSVSDPLQHVPYKNDLS
jgi:hypothetical protein